jgi:hypothetical protein
MPSPRVLVVYGEAAIRALVGRVVQDAGYEVAEGIRSSFGCGRLWIAADFSLYRTRSPQDDLS